MFVKQGVTERVHKGSGNSIRTTDNTFQEDVQTFRFTNDDVKTVVASLKAVSAPGPDKVHLTVLEDCAADLTD